MTRTSPAKSSGVACVWNIASAGDDKGFKPLFNGKDLKGWKTFLKADGNDVMTIVVKDGEIQVDGFPNGFRITHSAQGLHRRPEKRKIEELFAEVQPRLGSSRQRANEVGHADQEVSPKYSIGPIRNLVEYLDLHLANAAENIFPLGRLRSQLQADE